MNGELPKFTNKNLRSCLRTRVYYFFNHEMTRNDTKKINKYTNFVLFRVN